MAISFLGRMCLLGMMWMKTSVVHGGLGGLSENFEGTAGVVPSRKETKVDSGKLR